MKTYLIYVGSKLYPKDIFIKEAETYGVNRCLPIRLIKNLSWGDKILLGNFISKERTEKKINLQGKEEFVLDGRANKTGGKAEVFGYFDIRGLNITASNEFKKELSNQLDILVSSTPNTAVQRQCGSYIIGNSYIVSNSIADIIEKAEKLNETKQEKIKFFISGKFYPFIATIEPINFSRTYIEVEIEKYIEKSIIDRPELNELNNYSKRAYIKIYAKRGRPKKEI
jgi:hypothetical protein